MATAFFIPGLTTEQAEARYRELAAGYQVGVPPPDKRPFSVTFMNPQTGKVITAEVGKSFDPSWSTVIAIFLGPPPGVVVVCEEKHQQSFIVPPDSVLATQLFDGSR